MLGSLGPCSKGRQAKDWALLGMPAHGHSVMRGMTRDAGQALLGPTAVGASPFTPQPSLVHSSGCAAS